MDWQILVEVVAGAFALVAIVESRGRSWAGWAALLLAVALVAWH